MLVLESPKQVSLLIMDEAATLAAPFRLGEARLPLASLIVKRTERTYSVAVGDDTMETEDEKGVTRKKPSFPS